MECINVLKQWKTSVLKKGKTCIFKAFCLLTQKGAGEVLKEMNSTHDPLLIFWLVG